MVKAEEMLKEWVHIFLFWKDVRIILKENFEEKVAEFKGITV